MVTVDGAAPMLSPQLTVAPARVTRGVPFAVSFDVDDPEAELTVRVGDRDMAPREPVEGFDRSFTYTPSQEDQEEGGQPVSVQATDRAGNSSPTATAAVFYDFTPPDLDLVVEPADGLVGAGEVLRVTTVVDDPLATVVLVAAGLDDEAEGPLPPAGEPAVGRTWSYTVPRGLTARPVSLVATARDEAGNETVARREAVEADGVAPALSNVRVEPRVVKRGHAFTVRFDAEEDPGVELRVLLDGVDMESQDPVGGFDYAFTYTPGEDDTEGSKPLTVLDPAGNPGEEPTGALSVVFDFTAPSVLSAEVVYLPAVGNPLNTVVGMKVGTTARVLFTTDEPATVTAVHAKCAREDQEDLLLDFCLARPPGEDAPEGGSECEDPSRGYSLLHQREHTLADAEGVLQVDSRCEVSVDGLTDAAENVRPRPVRLGEAGLLRVDTLGPPAAALDVSALKHLRLPWGAEQTGGVAGHYVVGAGLLPGQDPVEEPLPANLLGAGGDAAVVYVVPVGGTRSGVLHPGEVPKALAGVDALEVWLAAVDGAGNESSSRARVPTAEWVATMGGEVVGDDVRNPHLLEARPREDAALLSAFGESVTGAGLALPGGDLVRGAARQPWRGVAEGVGPSARRLHVMAYDAARGVTVLFGGSGAGNLRLGDTWEWDGVRWAQVADEDDGGPTPRISPAMAYDAARRVTVLYGGFDGEAEFTDTWVWDGESWELVGAGGRGGPSLSSRAVGVHSMASDPRRGPYLFGGAVGAEARETWAWRPAAPGLRLAARLSPAFGARPFDCVPFDACPIDEVSVRAVAGGVGDASTRVRLFDRAEGADLDHVWPADGEPVESLDAFQGAAGGTFTLVVEDHEAGNEGTLRGWCVRVNGAEGDEPCAAPERAIPLKFPLHETIEVAGVEAVDRLEVEVHLEHPDTSELTIDLHNDAWAGVEMQVWNGFAWETVAENDAPPDQPGALSHTTDTVGPLVFGQTREDKAINVRLKPKHPGGKRQDLGDLAADYLEVRVKYTHPAQAAPPDLDP